MTTVNDILRWLEEIAPQSEKEAWDNVGLLCGSRNQQVHRILIALDPFDAVVEEAIEIHADLILTHHPLIFHPLSSVTDDTPVGRTVMKLIRHNISAVNAHTNLDLAPAGVNDSLAKALGLEHITVISPTKTDSDGNTWGLLRVGEVSEQSLSDFLPAVKQALGCPGLRYVSGGRPVHRVAVGGGACAGELMDAVGAGCDTFVTSDVKYNGFWDAHDLGINLIDAGHFYTENPICSCLLRQISAAFPDVCSVISEKHRDCMKYC